MKAAVIARQLLDAGKSFYLGRDSQGQIFGDRQDHLLVIGPTRSGKTSRLLVPSLATHAGPVIAVSTRDDLLRDTTAARQDVAREFGGAVSQISLGGSDRVQGIPEANWQLTDHCSQWQVARDRAYSLVHAAVLPNNGDTIWRDASVSALAGCLYGAALLGHSAEEMASNIRSATIEPYRDAAEVLDPAGTHPSTQSFGWAFDDRVISTKTRQSVYFVLRSQVLGGFESKTAAGESFDLPQFLTTGASTAYLTIPYERRQQGAPLVAAFVEACVAKWRAIQRVSPTKLEKRRLLILLDEAANIAPLPSLPGLLTSGAGDGIEVIFALQDPEQANVWGSEAGVILGGTRVVALLPGLRNSSYLQELADLAEKSTATDVRVICLPSWRGGYRHASSKRLIQERTALEKAVIGSHGRDHWRIQLAEARRIAVQRRIDGILTYEDDTASPHSVLEEILAYTEISVCHERRSTVEVSDLTQGPSNRVVLFSGSRMIELTASHWRDDQVWQKILV